MYIKDYMHVPSSLVRHRGRTMQHAARIESCNDFVKVHAGRLISIHSFIYIYYFRSWLVATAKTLPYSTHQTRWCYMYTAYTRHSFTRCLPCRRSMFLQPPAIALHRKCCALGVNRSQVAGTTRTHTPSRAQYGWSFNNCEWRMMEERQYPYNHNTYTTSTYSYMNDNIFSLSVCLAACLLLLPGTDFIHTVDWWMRARFRTHAHSANKQMEYYVLRSK